jgi:Lrp/AsnC family leucine-responsive transcriptional regulator
MLIGVTVAMEGDETGTCMPRTFCARQSAHEQQSSTDHGVRRRKPSVDLDQTDRRILAHLRQDARVSIADLAREVSLSTAPVARRIRRMERAGVIRGYTAIVDEGKLDDGIEAFTEIRLGGSTRTGEIHEIVRGVPEVAEFYTIAGDPDVILRLHVTDVDDLQRVVNALRSTGKVSGTRTLIVLHRWSRWEAAPQRESVP